jgi:hypothetical protein
MAARVPAVPRPHRPESLPCKVSGKPAFVASPALKRELPMKKLPLVASLAASLAVGGLLSKVFGLRLEQDPNGAYLPEYKNDYPFTYGSGKPELIHKEISGKHEGRAL